MTPLMCDRDSAICAERLSVPTCPSLPSSCREGTDGAGWGGDKRWVSKGSQSATKGSPLHTHYVCHTTHIIHPSQAFYTSHPQVTLHVPNTLPHIPHIHTTHHHIPHTYVSHISHTSQMPWRSGFIQTWLMYRLRTGELWYDLFKT